MDVIHGPLGLGVNLQIDVRHEFNSVFPQNAASSQDFDGAVHRCSCPAKATSKLGLRPGDALSVKVFENHSLNGGQADGELLCHAVLANHGAAKNFDLARSASEVTRPPVDGQDGHGLATLQDIEVMAQGAVRRAQHGLQLTVAEAGTSLERGENAPAQRVLGRCGRFGRDASKRHGTNRASHRSKSARDADHTACRPCETGRQPRALTRPLSEKRHG